MIMQSDGKYEKFIKFNGIFIKCNVTIDFYVGEFR